jgi:hypothetical protein
LTFRSKQVYDFLQRDGGSEGHLGAALEYSRRLFGNESRAVRETMIYDSLARAAWGFLIMIDLVDLSYLAAARNFSVGLSGICAGVCVNSLKTVDDRSVRTAQFREVLSIGVREGDEHAMFGKTVFFGVDSYGNIYVNDFDRKQIVEFSPNGRFIRTIGGPGQGPGEFTAILTPRFDKDGNLYVTDIPKRALIFFDQNGRYLRQVATPIRISDAQLTPEGKYGGHCSQDLFEAGKQPMLVEIYGLFDTSGRTIAEFRRLSLPIPPPPSRPRSELDDLGDELSFFYEPEIVLSVAENGRIYFGESADYVIDVYDSSGRKISSITRDVPQRKVERKDIDALAADILSGESAAVKREVMKLASFPENKPAYRHIAPLEDGGLAVVVDVAEKGAVLIDRFGTDGRFLERVKAAIPYRRLMFKNGKAYAIKKDDEGYNFIKVYKYSW